MLEAIGLSEVEESLYEALLAQHGQTSPQLAAQLGISVARTRNSMLRLETLGLVYRKVDNGGWAPVRPSAGLNALITRRQAELDQVRSGMDDLEDHFARGGLRGQPDGLIQVLNGRQAIADRALAIYHEAKKEMRIFDTPPYALDLSTFDELEVEGPLLGSPRFRTIYSELALDMPGRLDRIMRLIELGEESRLLPELRIKLTIVDDQMAMIPLAASEGRIESTLVIGPSNLLDALIALFEAYWVAATPFIPDGSAGSENAEPELTLDDKKMLALLNAGMTDEAIARRLGVSKRTARRRVYDIIDRLDGSTRFQAGVRAAKRGWL